jgi:adrenodoxin-NADP+ reductase
VVIIGQGNVALDCARILAKGTSQLVDTDIASHALEVLKEGVHTTTILGRRGHVQGAFTIKELRELTKLEKASFVVQEAELDLGSSDASLVELDNAKPKQRIDSLLREAAAKAPKDEKQVILRFLLNPLRFEATDNGALGAVICERTMLQGDAASQSAVGTGEYESVAANMALVSIGYKGVAIPGVEAFFDARRGIVRNTHGKVESGSATHGGLYVSGWLKRGPSGIIGTNISDAKDTVASIVKDWNASNAPILDDSNGRLFSLLKNRGVRVVDWKSYQKIEEAESDPRRKRSVEQPRQKISSHDELVKVALGHT